MRVRGERKLNLNEEGQLVLLLNNDDEFPPATKAFD
jgi:hypothetical protein